MYKNPKYLKSKIPKIIGGKTATFVLLLFVSAGFAQEMAPYCCAPPFVMTVVKPLVLISLDMTGSMCWQAYAGNYDSNTEYYGYFDPHSNYRYQSQKFWRDPTGPFPGNVMNWACMSRIDVARKVLSGGDRYPKIGGGDPKYLRSRDASWWRKSHNGQRFQRTATQIEISNPGPLPEGTYDVKINVEGEDFFPGVIIQIADKDRDFQWDDDAPYFALMFFSTYYGQEIVRPFKDNQNTITNFLNDLNTTTPSGLTPVGNAVLEAIHYIRFCKPKWTGDYTWNINKVGGPEDPWYDGFGAHVVPVWCRKAFCILIGDGESNSDKWYTSDADLPPGPFDPRNLYNYDTFDEQADKCQWGTDHHPADDYAYYGHITDLRCDGVYDLEDMQNITFYSIFAFGQGSALFKEIAKDGGFEDANADNIPQIGEYDKDGDGVPDNYFEAENGQELEEAMKKIIMDILAKVSSSSGVSVVTTGTKAGGSTSQSQFYPRKIFDTGEVLDWIGTTQSLWLDPFGLLREDTQSDAILHLQNDYVIEVVWDPSEGNVMITRYQDVYGNGDSLVQVGIPVPIEQLEPVWDAGKWLWDHFNPPAGRNIWTFINGIKTDFDLANNVQLRPYLGVGLNQDMADTTIRYVRGEDIDTTVLRSRTADGKVWKLGDVISSGAVAVQSAIERYDFIYGDNSYFDYYEGYKDRRQVVYVGANDGMLHCFNGGIPVELHNDPMIPMMLDPHNFDLGEELWAYIPYNLLPHLKWLKDPQYCHVYYVDLRPYVTDAQIFPPDPPGGLHPNGWGTILIGGMRLGGMPIDNDIDTCTSAYFAIDVTDPENPVPMWEFTHPDLALTICYSVVVKVDTSWFLIFGSGPMTCSGESNQRAKIFVLDLKTGSLREDFTIAEDASFITNIFGVDWGLDYTVDRIYCGTCHEDNTLPGNWGGKIYEILTHDKINPNTWTMTELFDMERPITGEGSVSTDDYNHLWVYFGSGRFFSDIDEVDMTYQRYIGMRADSTSHAATVADLYDVTNVWIDTLQQVQGAPGITAFDDLIDSVNVATGWWREFDEEGERVIATSLVFGGAVLFTAFVPTGDICSYGGEGNLWALFYRTGTAYIQPFLTPDSLDIRHPEKISLGPGMPSEPSLYVSADQTKVFIQAGGGIVSPETGIPGLPKSGVIIWKGR